MLPTDKSIQDHFGKDKRLISLVREYYLIDFRKKKFRFLSPIMLAIVFTSIVVFFSDKSTDYYDLLKDMSTTFIGFSVSILGFMTIAFSLIMTIADRKISLWLFCDTSSKYGIPPIKMLLLYFIYPLLLVLCVFLFSIMVYVISSANLGLQPLDNLPLISGCVRFVTAHYHIIDLIAFALLIFVTSLSFIELLSFIYNIYIFIVLYFGKMSSIQEAEIMKKIVNDEELDSYELDYEDDIIAEIKKVE
jgi:hypothetical protein